MPIEDFEGMTFVAFIDIAGFKKMMRRRNRALKVLDMFYNTGYSILREQNYNRKVEGIFISDCGILFVRGNDAISQIEAVLDAVREINKEMLKENIMLTTSIAYGKFRYQNRIEFSGIEKVPIYGNAYVDAFLDNEVGNPKIKPGQCRIVRKGLPESVEEAIKRDRNEIFRLVKERKRDRKHYYFYWNCQNPSEIEIFEKNYSNAEKLVYERYLKALKGKYWIRH